MAVCAKRSKKPVKRAKNEVLCPLCHGHGQATKEHLVVTWRSPEFEECLQLLADEAAFGKNGGLDEVFEDKHPVYSTEPE